MGGGVAAIGGNSRLYLVYMKSIMVVVDGMSIGLG